MLRRKRLRSLILFHFKRTGRAGESALQRQFRLGGGTYQQGHASRRELGESSAIDRAPRESTQSGRNQSREVLNKKSPPSFSSRVHHGNVFEFSTHFTLFVVSTSSRQMSCPFSPCFLGFTTVNLRKRPLATELSARKRPPAAMECGRVPKALAFWTFSGLKFSKRILSSSCASITPTSGALIVLRADVVV